MRYDGVRRVHRTVKVATSTTGAETGQTTIEFYDRQGRLVRVREPSGAGGATVDTNYKYDAASRLREAKTTSGATQTRQFTYDGRGLLLSEKHPEKGTFGNGLVSYLNYDARGHVHRRIDNGHDLTFTYDRAERLTKVEETSPLRVLKQFTYSDVSGGSNHRRGKLVQAVRHNDLDLGSGVEDVVVTEDYTYQGVEGRISRRDTSVAIDGSSLLWAQSFAYTPLGDIGSLTYPCQSTSPGVCDGSDPAPNRTVSYGYTSGFLTSVLGYANSITYHPNGALHQIVHANGASVTHGKDPNDMVRPASILLPGGPILNYTYDGSGNVKALGSETYAYDGVSRLKTASLSAGERHDYAYDAFGNLTLVNRTPNSLGIGDQSIPVSPATNRLSTGHSYDGSGNLLATPAGQSYTYDTLDMVTSTHEGDLYVYTADDERLGTLRSIGGGDREEVWRIRDLGGQVLRGWTRSTGSGTVSDLIFQDGFETGDLACWSYAFGGTIAGTCPDPPPSPAGGESWTWNRDYVHRQGLLLATVHPVGATEETLHYHLDHLGTPRSVTNSAGGLFSQHRYFPFGEETVGSGPGSADAMPLRFTGHERDFHDPPDFEEDVDYMHARYYRALYGRFLSVDPVGGNLRAPQSWNRYAYVYDNAINFVDPYGLFGAGATVALLPWVLTALGDTITVTSTPLPIDFGSGMLLFSFAPIELELPDIDVEIQPLPYGYLQDSVFCKSLSGHGSIMESAYACGGKIAMVPGPSFKRLRPGQIGRMGPSTRGLPKTTKPASPRPAHPRAKDQPPSGTELLNESVPQRNYLMVRILEQILRFFGGGG